MLLRPAMVAFFVLLSAPGCKRSSPAPTAAVLLSASVDLTPAPPPSRCTPPREGSVVALGEEPHEGEQDSLPFAVEVGQGVSFEEGFAVGALIPDQRGAKASVVILGPEGGSSRMIPLLTAHGDTPPPRLASSGHILLVGVLESGASSRRLKLGRMEAGAVVWGPELEQARDESLAFDLAVHGTYGVAVWDDETRAADRGTIKLFAFELGGFKKLLEPRVISPKESDAEMPRLAPRPGGFWLTWIARRPEKTDESDREVGEAPEFRWLEALPLDERGQPTGAPRRITPEKGHVLIHDLRALPGGNALVVYRDDDTPSGSSGGVLLRVTLRPDGASEPAVIADRHLGVGAPAVLDGWLAVADASAETRLARIGSDGALLDPLESEPILGRGEPLVARGDSLLVLQPRGQGVRLFVTKCH
ncbi:MAG: hypothetical protein RMJ98_08515 [Myxococcales bacterium]|nr:hypothetical protein [Polyangiaceae bacterium]MDW8249330.1 hypothetical protein [Myxococcales bacterium]